MPEGPQVDRSDVSFQDLRRSPSISSLQAFLSYLVFEGHGTRIGLTLSACIIAHLCVSTLVPWQAIGMTPRWSMLLSWFGCCSAIIVFDQLVLCKSVFILRKAYLMSLGGIFDEALKLIDNIGPKGKAFIRLPTHYYYICRAEVYILAEDYPSAETELTLSEQTGALPERVAIMRSRLHRAQEQFDAAREILETSLGKLGQTPSIRFEQGLTEFEKPNGFWDAKKIFKEVMEMDEIPHFCGETTYQLARAYWNATRLRTGEAEEGLSELSRAIERLRSLVVGVDTLRPVLAQLILERSHYLATHKEPAQAAVDLKTGLLFCNTPYLNRKANEIRNELQWRYEMLLP